MLFDEINLNRVFILRTSTEESKFLFVFNQSRKDESSVLSFFCRNLFFWPNVPYTFWPLEEGENFAIPSLGKISVNPRNLALDSDAPLSGHFSKSVLKIFVRSTKICTNFQLFKATKDFIVFLRDSGNSPLNLGKTFSIFVFEDSR